MSVRILAAIAITLFLLHSDLPGADLELPTFDAVAIRKSADSAWVVLAPTLKKGVLTAANITLRGIVAAAYGLTPRQVVGSDVLLDKNRFDLAGKAPEGSPDSQLQPMLVAFLRQRFKLVAHEDTREMPLYALEIASGGIQMSIYPTAAKIPSAEGPNSLRGTNSSIDRIAFLMSHFLDRPVVNRTGLTEHYNYVLVYQPLSSESSAATPNSAPDLFSAVQEQLGLKLHSSKGAVPVVSVDSTEALPTPN